MSDTKLQWYVWSVRAGKFEAVKRYLEKSVPEVKKVLYPTVTKERLLKSGEVKKSKSALYAGYMFLQYEHNEIDPKTWWKINKHPFVTTYVGPCTPASLASVDSLQKIEHLNFEEVKEFHVSDKVKVNGGVFKGYTGDVTGTSSNTVRVDLAVENKVVKVVFVPADLDILDRKTG